jgi:hypothetical protein
MRVTAFKSLLAAIILTAGGLSTHAAKAETLLKVPFGFTVSGQTMPAGVYAVRQDIFHNSVIFRNADGSKSFSYGLGPGDPNASEVHVTLRFASSSDGHVLQSIRFGSKTTARLDERPAHASNARLSQGR